MKTTLRKVILGNATDQEIKEVEETLYSYIKECAKDGERPSKMVKKLYKDVRRK